MNWVTCKASWTAGRVILWLFNRFVPRGRKVSERYHFAGQAATLDCTVSAGQAVCTCRTALRLPEEAPTHLNPEPPETALGGVPNLHLGAVGLVQWMAPRRKRPCSKGSFEVPLIRQADMSHFCTCFLLKYHISRQLLVDLSRSVGKGPHRLPAAAS